MLAGDPLASDCLLSDRLAGNPLASVCLVSELLVALDRDCLLSDLLAGGPLPSDCLLSDRLAGDPLASDCLVSDLLVCGHIGFADDIVCEEASDENKSQLNGMVNANRDTCKCNWKLF